MSGGQVMVVLIVAMVMIATIIKAKYQAEGRRARGKAEPAIETGETQRLRDEVKQLKERLAVIERITVEKENSLEREIERLRDQH